MRLVGTRVSSFFDTYSGTELLEYADRRLGSEGECGAAIPREANGSRSESVRRDCRCASGSWYRSGGVRGSIESVLERVDDTDLDGGRLAYFFGGLGESGDWRNGGGCSMASAGGRFVDLSPRAEANVLNLLPGDLVDWESRLSGNDLRAVSFGLGLDCHQPRESEDGSVDEDMAGVKCMCGGEGANKDAADVQGVDGQTLGPASAAAVSSWGRRRQRRAPVG